MFIIIYINILYTCSLPPPHDLSPTPLRHRLTGIDLQTFYYNYFLSHGFFIIYLFFIIIIYRKR